MAKKLRSPGQKRKLWIRNAMILFALIGLSVAYFIKGPQQVEAIKLVKQHSEVEASIDSLDYEEEEYRTAKGKRRTRDIYSVSYSFSLDGNDYEEQTTLSYDEYNALEGLKTLPIWFAYNQPETSLPKIVIQHRASESPVERVFDAGKYLLPLAFVLNLILAFLFGREPKGHMPEGFYSADSWLDIEDDRLVCLQNQQLLSVSFNKKNRDEVQEIYQRGGNVDEILSAVTCKQLRIDLSSIVSVSSEHFRDTIYVKYNQNGKEESESLEFLNPTVKAHALQQIARALPSGLNMAINKLTRLRAALPALVVSLLTLGILIALSGNAIAIALCVLVLAFSLKILLQRALDPTVITTFALNPAPAGLAVGD